MSPRSLAGFALIPALLSLPGCPAAAEGSELCRAADVSLACGIPDDECQVALLAHEDFSPDHGYTAWRVFVEEGRCIVTVDSLGPVELIDVTPRVNGLVFDVGEAAVTGP